MPEGKKERKWRPAPPDLIERFQEMVGRVPEAELRKMFGYPCAFVNGRMFTGLHQENMILRLNPEDRQTLLSRGAGEFSPMPGRVMREYVALPESIIRDHAALSGWLAKSVAHTAALPPKPEKKKKPSPKKAGKKA